MALIGHENIRTRFKDLMGKKSFPQTSLFYGLDSIGKKLVALECVAYLFCERRGADSGGLFGDEVATVPCGKCSACEHIAHGTHPDFFLVEPTPPASTKQKGSETKWGGIGANWIIKIEQIAELKSRLVHHPLMASHQVVVINAAEKMNATSANALLKIIEEPKPGLIFILITSSLGAVLPTLRSRSSKYYFAPLKSDEVRRIVLANLDEMPLPNEELLSFLFRCFGGSIRNILRALETQIDLATLARLTQSQNDFIKLCETVSGVLKNTDDLSVLLHCLRRYHFESVSTLSDLRSSDLDFFERISAAEWQLSRHLQKDFVLENLFL